MPQARTTRSLLVSGAPGANVCGDADAGNACFRLFPAPDCEPPLAYDLVIDTVAAIGATSLSFDITVPAGYPALSATNPFRLHAKDALTIRTAAGVLVTTAIVTETKDFTSSTNQTVQVEPLLAAVAVGDLALAWLGYPMFGVTTLNLQADDASVDTTKLKGGVQGSMAVTNRSLNVSIEMLSNQSDSGLWRVLQPYASLTTKDIFATIYMPPGHFAFVGMGNLTAFSINAAAKEKVRISVTFNAVSPFNTFPIRSAVQPATRLAIHDQYAEYSLRALTDFA